MFWRPVESALTVQTGQVPETVVVASTVTLMIAQGDFSLLIGRLPGKPSGHYRYHQFKINQFYVLPTQCIYVFCVDLRTNSDYFTVEH